MDTSTSNSPNNKYQQNSIPMEDYFDQESNLIYSTSETSVFSSPPSIDTSFTVPDINQKSPPTSTKALDKSDSLATVLGGSNLPRSNLGETIDYGMKKEGISINSIAFGNFTRDGLYSIEYSPLIKDGNLDYLKKEACLVLIAERSTSSRESIKILFSLDSVESITLDNQWLYLNLAYAPYYFVSYPTSDNINSSKNYLRTKPLDANHTRVAPYASRRIRLEFTAPDDRNQFLIQSKILPLPLIRYRSIVIHLDQNGPLYSQINLDNFQDAIRNLWLGHSFQLQAILLDGTLSPFELLEVVDRILEIVGRRGIKLTENILIELRRLLAEERKKREIDEGQDGITLMTDQNGQFPDTIDLLFEAESNVKETEDLARDKNIFGCYHVYLSASSMSLIGPIFETGNSVLRKHAGFEENFLRVSFVEEDQTKLQISKMGSTRRFFDQFISRTMEVGLELNGRTYELLAYSKASQRNHSVWMISPFFQQFSPTRLKSNNIPTRVDARFIIESMGDFQSIIYQPTLLGSRISQAFTSSRASVIIEPGDIVDLPDIFSIRPDKTRSCHTDGAGTMSLAMRNKICESLDISTLPLPTVIQVRVAGAKGLLVLDVELSGCKIGLRPSLVKFKGALDFEDRAYQLNVAQVFDKPSKLYLNRPLISALDDLGVPRDRFLELQKAMLDQIESETATLGKTKKLLARHATGQNLANLLDSLESIASDGFLKDESLQLYLAVVVQKLRDDIKYFARIEVPTGLQLVGVPDQDQILKEGEIYICTEVNGEKVVEEGMVAITRSPTLDPGDLRVVRAVNIPHDKAKRTAALSNCVVLPTVGKRSLSSMMSGGDLDGDLYQLILLDRLIPESTIPDSKVMEHNGDTPRKIGRPAGPADIAKNVVNFMEKDVVGILGIEHLKTADRYTGNSPLARSLAELYSRAVDYSKSGVEIYPSQIPRRSHDKTPDFLTGKRLAHSDSIKSYYSLRVLGYLFRAVPNAKDQPYSLNTRVDFTSSLISTAKDKLLPYIASQDLTASLSSLTNIATPLLNTFLAKISRCATIYNFPRRLNQKLSEAETFMGTILAVPRESDKQGRYAASLDLKQQVDILVGDIRKLVGKKRSLGEQVILWFACWEIALTSTDFGVTSFKWICIQGFFDTLELVERKSWRWREVESLSIETDTSETTGPTRDPPPSLPLLFPPHASSTSNTRDLQIADHSHSWNVKSLPNFEASTSRKLPDAGWAVTRPTAAAHSSTNQAWRSSSPSLNNIRNLQREPETSISMIPRTSARLMGITGYNRTRLPPLPPLQSLPAIATLDPDIPQTLRELNIVEEPELVLPKGRTKYHKNRATEMEKQRIALALRGIENTSRAYSTSQYSESEVAGDHFYPNVDLSLNSNFDNNARQINRNESSSAYNPTNRRRR